jgi:hypothetical protein
MTIKINLDDTFIRPTGVIIKLAEQKVFIPKSFILNKDTIHENECLDLEDWFYDIYIAPLEKQEKAGSQTGAEAGPGVIPI